MNDPQPRDRFWAALWIVAIMIISLSATFLQPALFAWANQTPGMDKLCHFLLVGGMSFWVVRALDGQRLAGARRGARFWAALIVLVVTIDEIAQLWITTRSFSLLDLGANAAGALCFSAWAARRRGWASP